VRASAGHFGNEHALSLDDDVLVRAMVDEIAMTMDVCDEPLETRVSRWPRAFPQYTPGHASRIDELEAALAAEAPRIVLAGAAYHGIGIPACVQDANRAAARVIA
jgi:oxygen-dependent protoporphyrinogen oxidase